MRITRPTAPKELRRPHRLRADGQGPARPSASARRVPGVLIAGCCPGHQIGCVARAEEGREAGARRGQWVVGGCARCGKVIGENCCTLVGECLVGDTMLAAFEPLVCDYTHSVTFLGMI